MKVHFHLYNDLEFCDDWVWVAIDMPFVPCIGDTIHLSLKEDIVIEKKLKKLGKSYNQYSYYKHGKDYRVGECIYVVNRLYRANSNTIHIELFDNKDTKNYDTFYESKPFI